MSDVPTFHATQALVSGREPPAACPTTPNEPGRTALPSAWLNGARTA